VRQKENKKNGRGRRSGRARDKETFGKEKKNRRRRGRVRECEN
jgi:hypothetical protein